MRLAVGAIRRGPDDIPMSLEDGEGRPESASQTCAVLSRGGDDALAVGAIRRGPDDILMSLEDGEGSP